MPTFDSGQLDYRALASLYEDLYGSSPDWRALPHALDFLAALSVYSSCFCLVVMLNTTQLINFYGHLLSLVLVPLSYTVNTIVIDEVVKGRT